ncbi:MAG: hypothetical protein JJ846_007845 [Prochlorococcus marinus CUG1437]|nr:hypothetical protein [Prochlorococcus marinus CUG1437]
MHKRNFKEVFAYLIIVISIIFGIKFRLIFTIPLLGVGSFLFLTDYFKSSKFHKELKFIKYNLSFLFVLISLFFSAANLFIIVNNKINNNNRIIKKGNYNDIGNFKKGEEEPLGYRYISNRKNINSEKYLIKGTKKDLIYDVTYNIDELNNRYTPNSKKYRNLNNSIIYLGGSFTFGEGLNDDQTLSYYIQELTGRAGLNLGLHGYGAHQALHILKNDDILEKKIKGYKPNLVIYRAISQHINRTAGYAHWDVFGPCYKINKNKEVIFAGSFSECGLAKTSIYRQIIGKLITTNEPFSRKVLSKFLKESRYQSPVTKDNFEKYILIINEMKKASNKKNFEFLVLLEDMNTDPNNCKVDNIYSEISESLKTYNIKIIRTSQIYTKDSCLNGSLSIKNDGHPSFKANKIIATYLSKLLN